jgi:hypothetical protein
MVAAGTGEPSPDIASCGRRGKRRSVTGVEPGSGRPRELRLHDAGERSDPRAADSRDAVELWPALRTALDSLTVQQRTVIVLRYLDDRSEAETAKLLGISVGTVKSTASRSIVHLRAFPGLAALFGHPPGPAGTATTVDVTLYLSITTKSTIPPNPYTG